MSTGPTPSPRSKPHRNVRFSALRRPAEPSSATESRFGLPPAKPPPPAPTLPFSDRMKLQPPPKPPKKSPSCRHSKRKPPSCQPFRFSGARPCGAPGFPLQFAASRAFTAAKLPLCPAPSFRRQLISASIPRAFGKVLRKSAFYCFSVKMGTSENSQPFFGKITALNVFLCYNNSNKNFVWQTQQKQNPKKTPIKTGAGDSGETWSDRV